MLGRSYFVGFVAVLFVSGSVVVAAPAGAISTACSETMAPSVQGSPSGLTVACTFTTAGVKSGFLVNDYADALWHSGAARSVMITERQDASGNTGGSPSVKNIVPDTPATQRLITAADINHSIEGPGIAPGTFITGVPAAVNLSQNTVSGGFACPGAPPCNPTLAGSVLIANSTARRMDTGQTFVSSNDVRTPVSVARPYGANFKAGDIGSRISGGDLPDGATIASIVSPTEVHLACVGCDDYGVSNQFLNVTNHSSVLLTITPKTAVTTHRFVTDGTFTHINAASGTIASPTARFANTDLGLRVFGTGVPGTPYITAVAAGGASATINANLVTSVGGNINHEIFTVGVAEKTAPANGNTAGQLALTAAFNPVLFPLAPACSANKVSAVQFQLQWRNPGAYDTLNNVGLNQYAGTNMPGTSTAELDLYTASTRLAGFVLQNVTVAGGIPTTTGWSVSFPFLPFGVGLCAGLGYANNLSINATSVSQQQIRVGTGPAGTEFIRALLPEPQGIPGGTPTAKEYVGATGANATTGPGNTNEPTNTNSCWVHSPNLIDNPCLP